MHIVSIQSFYLWWRKLVHLSNEEKTTFCKALRIFYHRTFLNRVQIAMDDSRDESITTTFNA
jgi:hypothetical protein